MATCSFYCQKKFLYSGNGVLKSIELIVGFGCWGLLYFGHAMSGSNEIPKVNDEALILTLTCLPSWIVTCATFIYFVLAEPTKRSLWVDTLVNVAILVAYGASTGICASSHNFIWQCISLANGKVIDDPLCPLPDTMIYRNAGQNLGLVILSSILTALYVIHVIYSVTKLCTTKILPQRQSNDGHVEIYKD